jgi:peptidoglycan/LPS O-acetylase OafA/YrhL
MLVATMLIQFVSLGAIRNWKWLDHPVLQFFGRISYSLYLYHIVVIGLVDHFFPHMRIRTAYPIIYGGSALAAYASYVIIERPFLRLKHRFEVKPAGQSRVPLKAQVAGASDVAS